MDFVPILRSKLTIPQPPLFLSETERYSLLCDKITDKDLVVITAPAGYGKTTLMVSALNRHKDMGGAVCWYRLDEGDKDLAVFYAHLVETLFPNGARTGEELRAQLVNCVDLPAQRQYLNALICQEMWACHRTGTGLKTILAFDDFQYIKEIPDIYDTLEFLLDNLSDCCRFMISSRCETGLLNGKRRLEKSFFEVTPAQLCFGEAEISGVLTGINHLTSDRLLAQKLLKYTEGWPAGIILACQTLSLSVTDGRDIDDLPVNKGLLFDYIISEAFNIIDEKLLKFLVKTTVLEEFTAGDASVIFGEAQASELLETCLRRGLFIQKIAGSDEDPTYRYHSLFRESLVRLQSKWMKLDEIRDYHLKAAAYYTGCKKHDTALQHYIACGDVETAVDLITRESAGLLTIRASEHLRLWLKLLPDTVVQNNGYLMYIKGYIVFPQTPYIALPILEQAYELFRQSGDDKMQLYTLFTISIIHYESNNIQYLRKTHAQGLALSEKISDQDVRNMLDTFDFCLSVWQEEYIRAKELFQKINIQQLPLEWYGTVYIYSAQMYCFLGDLQKAEIQIKKALNMPMMKNAELLKGFALLTYAVILQMKDDRDILPGMILELKAIGEKYDKKFLLAHSYRLSAVFSLCTHHVANALEQLDISTGYFDEIGNKAMASANLLYRCLWQCRGKKPELLETARNAVQLLTALPAGTSLREAALSVLGVIARESGEYEMAETYLNQAVREGREKGEMQITAGATLHLAKLYYDTGREENGDQTLKAALEIMQENGYAVFRDLHFPTLAELAVRCIRKDIHSVYARNLLLRHYGSDAAALLENTPGIISEAHLSDYTNAFFSGAEKNSAMPVIRANLLGRFSISINGVIIPDQEWKTKKITGLLKYLLVYRGKPVYKERLMSIFWPRSDKNLASISLRAALYELKKVLRKYGADVEGNAQFLFDRRDILEVPMEDNLMLDIDLFLLHYEELKRVSADNRVKRKKLLEEMLTLYQGDLLEEEIYEDWTFTEREELRTVYLKLVPELADILAGDGEMDKAEKLLLKTLNLDRYNEEACLSLIRLYISSNQRSRAVKLYGTFTERYKKELGFKPDDRLKTAFGSS